MNEIVSNLINANGNATANQFVIDYDSNVTKEHYRAFQSYRSRVCEIALNGGMGFRKVVKFGADWDYSRTTMKHLSEFLRQNGCGVLASAKDIREAIDRGHARHDQSIAVIYDPTMQ